MGYTKDAIKGFGWQSSATAVAAGITAAKLMVLARLLSQDDFGLFALVTIALGLTEAITQTGINFTILQSKERVEYFIDTAWVIAMVRGVLIAFIMVLLGFAMTYFYQEPQLIYLVSLAASIPIIKGLINPAIISWQKNLQFGIDSTYRLSLVAVEAIIAIALAVVWQSAAVLIFSMIGAAFFEVAISFLLLKLRPVLRFSTKKAWIILNNAKGLSISAALDYLAENVDELVLGKTVGTTLLGSYHAGYALTHRPTVSLAQSLNHSTFPVFTRIGDDLGRLRKAFFKSSTSLLLLAALATIPLIIFPEQIVHIILGEKWLNIVPMLPWLALAGFLQAVVKLCYNLLISQKKYRIMNWHRIISIVIFIPLLIWLSQSMGLTGAAIAWVIARLLPLPLIIFGIIKLLK